ncbi:hypothetical protein B0G76_2882 [Paraburkholderia sp. BL23I1N1]|uniref:hypothetical protein n=1 Tax=Paraburkholderia sp. BL23I1N1 TaxID=1938802 RepID=UPI000E75B73E|nr:hypothetical protein [Paraburkholderia sp. BL23I1N1]RKE36680.1 hypothetical protein B0G76_2882 [Paraburkholderia sp. BL23I1N1]
MTVSDLMDALRRLDPDMTVAVRTHSDFREVRDVEPSEGNLAAIDIRFSERVADEPSDDYF